MSLRPESTNIIRRAELLRKGVPKKTGRSKRNTFDLLYGQMDDGQSCQKMSEADGPLPASKGFTLSVDNNILWI